MPPRGDHRYLDTVASGFLLKKEIEYLDRAVKNPKRPFVAIIGGVKISGKIDVITTLLDSADTLLIGGGMMFTFLQAQGREIGKSVLKRKKSNSRRKFWNAPAPRNVSWCCRKTALSPMRSPNDAATKSVSVDAIPDEWQGLDIGPETRKKFAGIMFPRVRWSGTVPWVCSRWMLHGWHESGRGRHEPRRRRKVR